jgi:polysaccharide export outer membrane protein
MTTKTYKQLFLLAGIAIALSSCISPKETNLLQPGKPYYPVKIIEDYRLKPNDEIYCSIITKNLSFMEEYKQAFVGILSADGTSSSQNFYIISDAGFISIPFFGEIRVEGLTIPDAENVIQRKMRTSFPDAQVRVRLKNNMFYMLSSSSRNGVFRIYKDNMTIYQALSMAGNIAEDVDLSKVKIIRTDREGKSVVKTFNLKTESIIESEYYYIRPNDLIYFSTSNSSFFKVTSFSSLFTTVLTPITFLSSMLLWKYN